MKKFQTAKIKVQMPAYNPDESGLRSRRRLVLAVFGQAGIPAPVFEFKFCNERKWRFDLAWPRGVAGCRLQVAGAKANADGRLRNLNPDTCNFQLALEVQGGIWTGGRHVRGAALVKEMEKLNAAACLGWRVLFVQPKELLARKTIETIRCALGISQKETK